MSGFENYTLELRSIDHEIIHWAMVCGIDPGDEHALQSCRAAPLSASEGHSIENLRGLLLLRMKLEAEMLEQGKSPPAFRYVPDHPISS